MADEADDGRTGRAWQRLREAERDLARLLRGRAEAPAVVSELARIERAIALARAAIAGQARPAAVATPGIGAHGVDGRDALVREWGAWSAGEVADRAGSSSGNRSALAAAWRGSGRIVGVEWNGRLLYPGFQFAADGQPRPVIGRVLMQLRRAQLDDWQCALWFTSPNGWLDDRCPVELLDDAPALVEGAAAAFDALVHPRRLELEQQTPR